MTTVQKFVDRNTPNGGFKSVIPTTLGGAGHEGQVVATDPVTGTLDQSLMPPGIGPESLADGICGTTAITAGMYVNVYNNGGVKTVRPADSSDATKPAQGFVRAGYTVGQPVTVYAPSQNNDKIPTAGFTAADVGKPIYLGTNGAITLTRIPDGTTGAWDQQLGEIDSVGVTVTSVFKEFSGIVVA